MAKIRKGVLAAINKRLRRKLKEISLKDPLTGLYNYQYFSERLDVELKHAKKYIFPISLIMVDIDYFESINNTYGYRVGNGILKEFAQFLKKFARASDIVTRYSGARFAIISPDTKKEGAVTLGERLCEKIQKHTFRSKRNRIKLKTSIGVTNFPDDNIDNVIALIDATDKAVHNAKEEGGNRVCTFEAVVRKAEAAAPTKEDIEDLKLRLKKAGKRLDQALLESIYAFAKAIEARDHYTGEHAEKMIYIVRSIGKELALPRKSIVDLEHAAVLHDLGKIGIDDNILHKPGKLTKKEFKQIKKHPIIGAEILRSIHFLRDVIPLILYHHERYDGKGYTSGLKGKEIPIGARVLAIADVYQALISDRPYRKAYTRKEAFKIIKDAAGTQFDPVVVNAFIKSVKKRNRIA